MFDRLWTDRTIRKGLVDAALAGAGILVGVIVSVSGDLNSELVAAIVGGTAAAMATLRRVLRDWQDGQPE